MKLYILIALIILSCKHTSYATDVTSNPPLPKIENNDSESVNSELKARSFSERINGFFSSKEQDPKEPPLKNDIDHDDKEPEIDLNKVNIPTINDTDSNSVKKELNLEPIDEKKTESISPSNTLPKEDNKAIQPKSQLDKNPNIVKEVTVEQPANAIESIANLPTKEESIEQIPPSNELKKKNLPELHPAPSQTTEDVITKSQPKKDLSVIPKPALNKDNVTIEHHTEISDNQDMQGEVDKFVVDEAKMLLLPNDDIILGELSKQAKLDQMDFYLYIELYKHFAQYDKTDQEIALENFIANYDANFNEVSVLSLEEAKNDAFEAARTNNLFKLRVLLDNYQLLQAKEDQNYTLLHQTAELDHYHLTKFLIMRGTNLLTLNKDYKTPLTIAIEHLSDHAASILRKAGAK